MNKILIAVVMMVAAFCSVEASLWTAPVKAGVKKVAAQVGGRAGGEVAVRGGTALAKATATRTAAKVAAEKTVETTIKAATPGKILAVGGAAALVTGTHEAADGVQQIGEAIGDATRKDPGLAARIADAFMKPFTWFVTMFAVAGAGLLVWFVLPFLSLVRNWMKLRAMRQMAKMQPVYAEVVDVVPGDATVVQGRPGKVNIRALVAVAGFAVVTVLGVVALNNGGKGTLESVAERVVSEAPDDAREKVAKRAQVVSELQQVYERTVQRHYEAFLSNVEKVSDAEFGKVRDGIPAVADSFGTFSRCKRIVCDCVLDKMKGGNRTSENIKRDLEQDYYTGLYDARDRVIGCLETLRSDLDAARGQFEASLKYTLAEEKLPGDDSYQAFLVDCGERIEAKKAELSDAQLTAGIAVAIEAVLIRETVATVSKCFAKCVARQSAAMAGGAAVAVADGPFPFGDILGGVAVAGTTAWTCYDVYKASKVIPGELRNTLTEVTRDSEKQCLDEVRAAGERALRIYSSLVAHG